MKKIIMLLIAIFTLGACSESVDVESMYEVSKEQDAQQNTMNVDLITLEKYDENDLKKVIIYASAQYNHDVVNGIRFNIIEKDGNGYAKAKIAFNKTGMNATGVKKKNIAEIKIN